MHRSICATLVLLWMLPCASEPLWIGRFEAGATEIPAPWEVRSINAKTQPTRYQMRLWDDVPAVEAVANHSMAMLARPVSVDLTRSPVLCWRWRVDAAVAAADIRRKSGDDYAARIYVGFRLAAGSLSTFTRLKLRMARTVFGTAVPDAALSYVWDNQQPVGTELPSSYTDRVQMLVLRSGEQDSGSWRSERRNILEDFVRRFGVATPAVALRGSDPPQVEFVAFGSDTDNTGSTAHAGFADLHFVAPAEPCDVRP